MTAAIGAIAIAGKRGSVEIKETVSAKALPDGAEAQMRGGTIGGASRRWF